MSIEGSVPPPPPPPIHPLIAQNQNTTAASFGNLAPPDNSPSTAPTPSSETPYYIPNQNQSSYSSGTSGDHPVRNAFLSILLVLMLLLVGGTIFGYWTYVRPRLSIAQALSGMMSADSVSMRLEVPLKNDESISLHGDVFTDESLFSKRSLQYQAKGSLGQQLTSRFDIIENNQQVFYKPASSHMKELYVQFLQNNPGAEQDPALQKILPVLHGDSWAQSQKTIEPTSEISENLNTDLFFMALSLGTELIEYDDQMKIGESTYTFSKLRLRTELLTEYANEAENADEELQTQVNSLLQSLSQKTTNPVLITILIDNKSKTLHRITIKIAEEILEVASNWEIEEGSSPFNIIFSNPVDLLAWMPLQSIEPHITLEFDNYNQVATIVPPSPVVDLSDVDSAEGLLWYLMSFFSNKKNSVDATSQSNEYLTSNKETQLAFNQGEYAQGLAKAEESLSYASTDEEKAYAYYWMGLHTYKLRKLAEAEELLQKAASLKQGYAGPYVTLGAISADRGNYEQMKQYSLKCMEYDPDYAWCYNNLGLSYAYQDRINEAIVQLEKAVALDPLNFVFNDNLKRVKENR